MKVATYLEFKDNANEVIETYQSVLGAEILLKYVYDEDMTDDPALIGKIFHAELKIGDLNLYLCDSGVEPSFESIKLVTEIQDEAKAHEIFERLAVGGKVIREFTEMSFGPTIADVEDMFGIKWNIVIC